MTPLPTSDARSVGGADFLQLSPGDAPSRGLTGWLVDAVRSAIIDGRLLPGVGLPPTRALADDLRISRGVVVEAYRRLGDEGLVGSRQGSKSVVLPTREPTAPRQPSSASTSAASALRLPAIPSPDSARSAAEIDLTPGLPDLSAFPRTGWLRAERTALQHTNAAELGYGDPRGNSRLRQQLAGWLGRTRGLSVEADDIIIVAGVAQSLALVARVLTDAGITTIGVEDPGSRGARDELGYWGVDSVPIPVDDEGLQVATLSTTGLRAALLTPAHQFPTGVVLAPQRRRDLLDWAANHDALLIEDDYDAEYRYDRAPVPALQASAPDRVAYTGSTSKTLAPGMRLGWLIPPRRWRDALVAAKHATDLGSPVIPQLTFGQLMAGGDYERHIRSIRVRQRKRRDALLEALREQLPIAQIQGVAAGLHLVVTLPEVVAGDDVALAGRILAAGVRVQPLSIHRMRPGPPGLVLGYAAETPGRLRESARRIATAVLAGRPDANRSTLGTTV